MPGRPRICRRSTRACKPRGHRRWNWQRTTISPRSSRADSQTESLGLSGGRSFLLEVVADAEHVAIGMAYVHLTKAPRHVGGRPGDLEALVEIVAVGGVHVVHQEGQPRAAVHLVLAMRAEGRRVAALAPAALA